jgi:hypothetical protein
MSKLAILESTPEMAFESMLALRPIDIALALAVTATNTSTGDAITISVTVARNIAVTMTDTIQSKVALDVSIAIAIALIPDKIRGKSVVLESRLLKVAFLVAGVTKFEQSKEITNEGQIISI